MLRFLLLFLSCVTGKFSSTCLHTISRLDLVLCNDYFHFIIFIVIIAIIIELILSGKFLSIS